MDHLILNRSRLKLLKYIFLSAGGCIFLAIIITLYLKNSADEETKKALAKQNKKLSKNYSLSINKPIFEGVTGNLSPYKILANSVNKTLQNQYTLQDVNANCKLNNTNVNAKATSAILDDSSKFITLKNNVLINLDDAVLKCEEIKLNLENHEVSNDTGVSIDFKKSNIKADSLNTKDSNNIIEFNGNIESNFNIENF
jgi:hypothetical protein